MIKSTGLIVCLCLIGLTLGQTNFQNTCQTDSMFPLLATGLIHLNPLDTYNNGAKKDYYQDLTFNNFTVNDYLGYGFSLTGFETTCTNSANFFSLVIDEVVFENQNKRMRIVVDFRDPGSGAITAWTMVSFTYIVVSRNFNGAYSDIWASVADVNNPQHDNPVAIDLLGSAFRGAASQGGAACRIYDDPTYTHDPTSGACDAAAVDTAGTAGGAAIIHAYIMGFRYNAQQSTTRYLAAGVLPDYPVVPNTMESPNLAPAIAGSITITDNVGATTNPSGPHVAFYNPDAALTYIKVAFVYSRLDYFLTIAGGGSTYPAGSNMLYSSSYVFTNVTTFNTAVAITRATTTTEFNRFYYHLPDTRYAIYGITNFDIPQGAGCTTIKVNATLDSIDAFTVTTPNANPANMFFVADIFTKNIDQLCQPGNNALLASQIFTVGKKSFFTIPTQSLEQFIL